MHILGRTLSTVLILNPCLHMKYIIGFLIFVIVNSIQAQDSLNRPFERYWTKSRIVPRLGAGAQEAAFVEVGIAYHRIYVHPLSLASSAPYFSIDALIKEDEPIFGPKIGYGITAGLIGFATDVTYYTDFSKDSFMLTPKAGISILGFADLFYGYNIPLSEERFAIIARNRFSLILNINKDYFNLRDAGKRNVKGKG